MAKKLYVGNLPINFRVEKLRQELQDAFSEFGDIEKIFLVRDKQNGRFKGFGFITFYDEAGAKHALTMDGYSIGGRQVRVSFAREKDAPKKLSFWAKLKKALLGK